MKDKSSEWISVADLMSGVMAVVMLLLVVSVVQKTHADLKHKQEEERVEASRKKNITEILKEIKTEAKEHGLDNLMRFSFSEGRITLHEGLFDKGSACVPEKIIQAFNNMHGIFEGFLTENKMALIYVEGHTDSLKVSQPVTNYEKFCTVYDDNFTLSAARAREARNLLISNLDERDSKRVVVAGYGDSRLLEGIEPTDGRNRRVEIRLTIPVVN